MTQLPSLNDISNELKTNINNWNFVNVFKLKGVQAICGLLI